MEKTLSRVTACLANGSPAQPGEPAQKIFIRIADIGICVSSDDPTLPLQLQGAVNNFAVDATVAEAQVRIRWGNVSAAACGKKLFDSGGLWQLFACGNSYRLRFRSAIYGALPYKEACFNNHFTVGEIVLHQPYFATGRTVDPMEYPLDELLMVHLLARGRGAIVHSSGIVDAAGNGHLFIGQSGAGKSTMARLWQHEAGAKILSDDRIALRKLDGKFWIYGTPWHGDAGLAEPERAPLTAIYFLRHGETNRCIAQTDGAAVGRLFACSFPPVYCPEAVDFTLGFFHDVVNAVPCHELSFVPDRDAVRFINRMAA